MIASYSIEPVNNGTTFSWSHTKSNTELHTHLLLDNTTHTYQLSASYSANKDETTFKKSETRMGAAITRDEHGLYTLSIEWDTYVLSLEGHTVAATTQESRSYHTTTAITRRYGTSQTNKAYYFVSTATKTTNTTDTVSVKTITSSKSYTDIWFRSIWDSQKTTSKYTWIPKTNSTGGTYQEDYATFETTAGNVRVSYYAEFGELLVLYDSNGSTATTSAEAPVAQTVFFQGESTFPEYYLGTTSASEQRVDGTIFSTLSQSFYGTLRDTQNSEITVTANSSSTGVDGNLSWTSEGNGSTEIGGSLYDVPTIISPLAVGSFETYTEYTFILGEEPDTWEDVDFQSWSYALGLVGIFKKNVTPSETLEDGRFVASHIPTATKTSFTIGSIATSEFNPFLSNVEPHVPVIALNSYTSVKSSSTFTYDLTSSIGYVFLTSSYTSGSSYSTSGTKSISLNIQGNYTHTVYSIHRGVVTDSVIIQLGDAGLGGRGANNTPYTLYAPTQVHGTVYASNGESRLVTFSTMELQTSEHFVVEDKETWVVVQGDPRKGVAFVSNPAAEGD